MINIILNTIFFGSAIFWVLLYFIDKDYTKKIRLILGIIFIILLLNGLYGILIYVINDR